MAFADAPPSPGSAFHRLLSKIIDVRPSEVPALAWSWLYIFSLLSSYYIMRPIRDQMGVAGGVNNLQWLFTGTLIGMLLLNLPFSYLVKTFPREKFIAISYRFFSANILLFALALYAATPEQTIWVGRIFFIWTSIFNLFVVSIFWQMIVDIFTSEQGKRLFGFIAAGATLGAISGSAFTVSTVEHMAPAYLMIGAALMLEVAVFCVRRLSGLSAALSERPQVEQPQQPIGGTLLGGIRDALSSSYLLNVSLFLLLYAVTSTFLYFQQAAVVSHSFESRAAQTAFFATVDLGVNVLTLAVQLFLTGRILKRFGVGNDAFAVAVLQRARLRDGCRCCRRCRPSSDFNCFGAPAILRSRGRRARCCSRCCRARIATRPRALSTPWSIGWAIKSAPGRSRCSRAFSVSD